MMSVSFSIRQPSHQTIGKLIPAHLLYLITRALSFVHTISPHCFSLSNRICLVTHPYIHPSKHLHIHPSSHRPFRLIYRGHGGKGPVGQSQASTPFHVPSYYLILTLLTPHWDSVLRNSPRCLFRLSRVALAFCWSKGLRLKRYNSVSFLRNAIAFFQLQVNVRGWENICSC